MEVIHVELTDKGCVVAVSEVDREDVLRELLDLLHDESFAVFGPADDICILRILNSKISTSRIS